MRNNVREELQATVLIDEVYPSEKGFASGPERALLSALLFDGVQSYLNYFAAISSEDRASYEEANNWVHSSDDDYIFSFVNVCEGLGIDSDKLRIGLSNVVNSKITRIRRRA